MILPDEPALAPAVLLQSVDKAYPSRLGLSQWLHSSEYIPALRRIDLRASRGEVVALMGPNGSGKSTLLKLLAATLLPDSGHVVVQGFDTALQPLQVRRAVGFAVAQERSFFPRLTAYENLLFFSSLDEVPRRNRRDRVNQVLEEVGLANLRSRFVHQFSTGMYSRLAVARALLKQPSCLLLDEPTRSADSESTLLLHELIRRLARQGVTVFLATHSREEAAALADTTVILNQGRIAACVPKPEADRLRSLGATCSWPVEAVPDLQREVCPT